MTSKARIISWKGAAQAEQEVVDRIRYRLSKWIGVGIPKPSAGSSFSRWRNVNAGLRSCTGVPYERSFGARHR
jgi:hypothetical protein